MQTIDFLPEHYRERRKQRRVRWWWALIVCLFGGVVLATGSLQWLSVQKIKNELDRLEMQCNTFRQLDQHLLELETKVTHLSHRADLYTFLKHPWPRTQILAAVVHPLPEKMQLSSIRITESLVARAAQAAPPPESAADPKPAPPDPPVADLQQLHDAHEAQRVVVMVEGSVAEVEALHSYLDALGRQALVAEARLNSLETRKLETGSQIVFQLQLTIKAGHGLSGSPPGPLLPVDGESSESIPPETATLTEEKLR